MEATAAAAAAAAGAEGARAAEVARRREGRAAAMTAAEGLEAEAREEGTEYCGRAERRTGRADAGRADAGSAIRRSEAIFISMSATLTKVLAVYYVPAVPLSECNPNIETRRRKKPREQGIGDALPAPVPLCP